MARIFFLAAIVALASGFQAPAVSKVGLSSQLSQPARTARVTMEETSAKATTIGAAAVGGIVGVYFFHELSTAVVLATAFAYGSTMNNKFGDFTSSAGSAASKVYGKTLEINEQYDVLPKAKSALDVVSTAAGNLDSNYGITKKIDEQLKLSQSIDKVSASVQKTKDSLTAKVDDLKEKASSSD